jgi:signal transduction histidine kinase
MKATSAPVTQLTLPLAIAAVVTVFTFGILYWHTGFAYTDAYLFSQLITGLTASRSGNTSVQHEFWFNLTLAVLFTGTAALAGYKLGPKASFAALLQLLALLLLCQWLLWSWYSIHSHPVALFISTTVALVLTRALATAAKRRSSVQTRSYELMLRNLELERTRMQIVRHDEVERRLLAADLHDQVLNDLKIARQKFTDYINLPSATTAAQIENLLSQAMEEIHEVMDNLSPSVLEHLGLTAAVDELLRNACQSSGMKTRLSNQLTELDLRVLSTARQALLYRLIQESITNACKHAQGKTLTVTMTEEGSEIVIRITDDGKGMDLDTVQLGSARGIRYMRQRADLIGAKITWRRNNSAGGRSNVSRNNMSDSSSDTASGSSRSGGTVVEIRLPMKVI